MFDLLRDGDRLSQQAAERHSNVIQELLEELHNSFGGVKEGRVADYIPELAKACPDDFGIVIAASSSRHRLGGPMRSVTQGRSSRSSRSPIPSSMPWR
jgi:glutaminase